MIIQEFFEFSQEERDAITKHFGQELCSVTWRSESSKKNTQVQLEVIVERQKLLIKSERDSSGLVYEQILNDHGR